MAGWKGHRCLPKELIEPLLRRQWAPGQVCVGRGTCGTCVTLPPLLALSGVAEMPDNEVSGCTKRFLVPERGRAGLGASWPQPPPCNSWVAAGGSGLPGGARTCRPLHVAALACWLRP